MFNKLRGQFAIDAQAAKEREANALAKDEHVSVQPEDTSERGSERTKESGRNADSKDIELDIYEFIDLCLKCPEDQHQFIYLRQKDPDDYYDLCTVPFRNIDSNLY